MLVDGLLTGLERPVGCFRRAAQLATWSLSKKEVKEHLARIGRVKSWFALAMMTDSMLATA